MPEDNFIPYQVKFNEMDTFQLIFNDYSYNLHYPTNFPNYKTPPVNFVKENSEFRRKSIEVENFITTLGNLFKL